MPFTFEEALIEAIEELKKEGLEVILDGVNGQTHCSINFERLVELTKGSGVTRQYRVTEELRRNLPYILEATKRKYAGRTDIQDFLERHFKAENAAV